ncbi:hypothetical protein VNO77_28937 [Canavalia gladiata]|uniref:Uncharacterized protein n=1 Tax=Canavalia gladiata TaxID=3824 RepID=A0AAN9KXP9_CANGL
MLPVPPLFFCSQFYYLKPYLDLFLLLLLSLILHICTVHCHLGTSISPQNFIFHVHLLLLKSQIPDQVTPKHDDSKEYIRKGK